jgi:hypothetical protein
MPRGLIARLRRRRRPAVLVAAGLVAVQAFLAGVTMAQALMRTSNPADIADLSVICHANGGSVSDNRAAGDSGRTNPATSQHPCCEACVAGAAPATLPAQLTVRRTDRCWAVEPPVFSAISVRIAPRAVRAGASQAPPILD